MQIFVDVKRNRVLQRATQLHLCFTSRRPENFGLMFRVLFLARWVCVTLNGSFSRPRY
jgi:hypothetical protein